MKLLLILVYIDWYVSMSDDWLVICAMVQFKPFPQKMTYIYLRYVRLFNSTHQSTPLNPSGVPFGLHNQCICIMWLSLSGYVSLSEYNPAYQTLHFSDTSLMHL